MENIGLKIKNSNIGLKEKVWIEISNETENIISLLRKKILGTVSFYRTSPINIEIMDKIIKYNQESSLFWENKA